MSLFNSPEMEQAVLKESEDSLKALIQAFENVGIPKAMICLMLRAAADDIDPPRILDAHMH